MNDPLKAIGLSLVPAVGLGFVISEALHGFKRQKLAFWTLLLSCLTIAGWLWLYLAFVAQPYAYRYSTTVPGHFQKAKTGRVTYLQPAEFRKVGQAKSHAAFAQYLKRHAKTRVVGSLVTTSGLCPLIPKKDLIKIYSSNLAKPVSSPTYQLAVDLPRQFAAGRWLAPYSVTLGQAEPTRNPNLPKSSWQFDFEAVNRKDTSAQRYLGKLVYVVTPKAFYYWMVSAVDYNWRDNQAYWQNLINSLQVS